MSLCNEVVTHNENESFNGAARSEVTSSRPRPATRHLRPPASEDHARSGLGGSSRSSFTSDLEQEGQEGQLGGGEGRRNQSLHW